MISYRARLERARRLLDNPERTQADIDEAENLLTSALAMMQARERRRRLARAYAEKILGPVVDRLAPVWDGLVLWISGTFALMVTAVDKVFHRKPTAQDRHEQDHDR